MKKRSIIFFSVFLVIFVFTSCMSDGNRTGTHTHADGTVHQNDHHENDSAKGSEQESFKVEGDAIENDTLGSKEEVHSNVTKEHTHDHGDGKKHSH